MSIAARDPKGCVSCGLKESPHCVGCVNEPIEPCDRTRAVYWVVDHIAPALFDAVGAVNAAGIQAAIEVLLEGSRLDREERSWLYTRVLAFAGAIRSAKH